MNKLLSAAWGSILFGAMALTAAPKPATIVYACPKDAKVLDPGVIDEFPSARVVQQVFEPLLRYKPGTTQIEPCLAESLPAVSKDGLELTFKLRKGVQFHDGTPFNADAVVFSFKRQTDKSNFFFQFGPWKYWNSKGWASTEKKPGIIKDIVKVDDATVKVLLNTPDSTVTTNFAAYPLSIVSPTAAQKLGADFRNNPVGTGPFQFVKWQKDDQIVLKRFDGYWGQKAKPAGVIFKVVPDEQARIMALKKGEADLIDTVGPEGLKSVEADPNLKVQSGDVLGIHFLSLNCESGPFVNKQLRQAFSHAINRQVLLSTVYGKTALYEKLPLPSVIWGYDKSIKDYAYDPEKAKALIKASGVSTPIKVNMIYYPDDQRKKVAEIIQAQLKTVGFDVAIQTYESGTYWDNVDAGKFDVCNNSWTGEPDPDTYLYSLFTEGYLNASRWKNKGYIELVTKAKTVYGIPERSKLYSQAEKILMEETPVLMLFRGMEFRPMNRKVQGYVVNPLSRIYFEYLSLN